VAVTATMMVAVLFVILVDFFVINSFEATGFCPHTHCRPTILFLLISFAVLHNKNAHLCHNLGAPTLLAKWLIRSRRSLKLLDRE
jgi:hypothetical protein